MDFTREPIIETIVTPREGFKLVVRSSKGLGQEEYFVEAVEIVSFGSALFFRSLERPKCFMVPVTDYEILEVREARMVLKNVGVDSTIKIGGGREGRVRGPAREAPEKVEAEEGAERTAVAKTTNGTEARPERKRERRRNSRRRRGGRDDRGDAPREQGAEGDDFRHSAGEGMEEGSEERIDLPAPRNQDEQQQQPREKRGDGTMMTAILPPPTQLISETLDRYREDELFRGVFQVAPKLDDATPDDIQSELKHEHPEIDDAEPEAPEVQAKAPRQRRTAEPKVEAPVDAPEEFAGSGFPEEDDLP